MLELTPLPKTFGLANILAEKNFYYTTKPELTPEVGAVVD